MSGSTCADPNLGHKLPLEIKQTKWHQTNHSIFFQLELSFVVEDSPAMKSATKYPDTLSDIWGVIHCEKINLIQMWYLESRIQYLEFRTFLLIKFSWKMCLELFF